VFNSQQPDQSNVAMSSLERQCDQKPFKKQIIEIKEQKKKNYLGTARQVPLRKCWSE
jgi:hypothetical protein